MTAISTPPGSKLLAFSGGGFNTHSILAGMFAGALDQLDQLGDEAGLATLMRDVAGIGANSGGSWFLTHLAYSQIFTDQFDTRLDRDEYTTTGYIGAVEAFVAGSGSSDIAQIPGAPEILSQLSTWVGAVTQFLTDNFPEGSPAALQLLAELGVSASTLLQGFLAAAARITGEITFFLKLASILPQGSGLDQRLVAQALVYGPLGMDSELAAQTLDGARLAWAADVDFSIAAALPTRDALLHVKPWLLGYDRMWSAASPISTGTQSRPLAIDSVVDAAGVISGQVTLPGGPVTLAFGNDKFFGPASTNVEVSSVLDASALGIVDATVASSAAFGLLARPDAFGAIAWLLRAGAILGGNPLAALAPIEKNLAQIFRDMAPLASLANGVFSMPQVPAEVDDFDARYSAAVAEREVRVIDGAYIDNTAAAFVLRQAQSEQGITTPFDLTVFSSSNESTSAGIQVVIDEVGTLSSFRIRRDVALLFGLGGHSAPTPPGTAVDGPFPVLPDQMPSPQIFAPGGWLRERVEWEFQSGDLRLQFFDLDVVTVENIELGITGGQAGRLRVFAVNNQDATIFPSALYSNYHDNYNLLRAAIADESGGLHLLSALGLLPLISLDGSQLEVIGGDQAAVLIGRAGNDTLYGGESDDLLNGRLGVDRMVGGRGGDIYVCDNAGDWVVETLDGGRDWVRSWLSYALGDHLEGLVLLGDEGLSGTGNALDNRLMGSGGNDVLIGGAGDDLLNGRAGADTLDGGAGHDVYIVDSAFDLVLEAVDAGTDLVRSAVTLSLGDHLENMLLTGDSAINGTGNALRNRLIGNDAANVLHGGAGADWLAGGVGDDVLFGCLDSPTGGQGERDVLRGGADRDLFVLGSARGVFYDDGAAHTAGRADYALVLDFKVGEDQLQLAGQLSDYYLGATGFAGLAGTGLWWERGATDELIAVLRSANDITLTGLNTLSPAIFI